jgi:hypothetical protein
MGIFMKSQTLVLACIFGLFGLVGPAHSKPIPSSTGPKPALNSSEKPSEIEQHTEIRPGKSESEQPPPDAVGKVPHDMKRSGKQKETSKLLPKRHKHRAQTNKNGTK